MSESRKGVVVRKDLLPERSCCQKGVVARKGDVVRQEEFCCRGVVVSTIVSLLSEMQKGVNAKGVCRKGVMKTTIFMRCQDGVGVVFIKIVVHWQRSMLIVGWFELFLHLIIDLGGKRPFISGDLAVEEICSYFNRCQG